MDFRPTRPQRLLHEVSAVTTTDDRPRAILEFDTLVDRHGLEIVDHVESVRFELRTSERVQPTEAATDPFPYPMDSAVEIGVTEIEIPKLADVIVRDPCGEFITEYSTDTERETVPAGRYSLELTTAPLKLYLLAESALEIRKTDRVSVILDFGEETDVTVGARSFHERPAGTITVPDDVESMMQAVSLFGSALKTTSPERSFPTLRGHPPRVKLGDDFRASKSIDQPDTDVTIVLPTERRLLYAVAPLAYYLGAEVVPGNWPRLVAGDYEHTFPRPARGPAWDREADAFERDVHHVLRRTFFLDCVVRTEGIYPIDLHERAEFEKRVLADFDFATLYDQPLAERLETYLEVSPTSVQPLLPNWPLMADVVSTSDQFELLPYLVDDLALIRCTPPPEKRTLRPNDEVSIRMHGIQEPQEPPNEGTPGVHDMSYEGLTFDPTPTDAVEHAYAGDGYPEGSNKLLLEAFENQLRGPKTEGSPIKVHVVCNDVEAKERGLLSAVYGDRNLLDIEVSFDYLVTTDDLVDILHRPLHFLHFVGESTVEGLKCRDGVVDPRLVHDHGVEAFFVQHCKDYSDLEWLIRRGAFGGVVTTTPPADKDDALMMGRWMARLLNNGFTLRSAAQIVQQVYPDLTKYVVLGDGGLSLTQPKAYRPTVVEVESDEQQCQAVIQTYPTGSKKTGGTYRPGLRNDDLNYLEPKELTSIQTTHSELKEYLESQTAVVNLAGDYLWSDVLLSSSDF